MTAIENRDASLHLAPAKHELRVAVIGCGRMGASVRPDVEKWAPEHLRNTTHLQAVRSLGIAKATAAVDVSESLLLQAQTNFALDNTYADYRDMLTEFQPDLVTIATRTPLKYELLTAVIEAGVRAVHVEKPLCNSERERRALAELFAKDGVFVSSGCLRRYAAPYLAARDWFASTREGEALEVAISMGRSPLAWTLFHAVDLALFLAGSRQVAYVQASLGEVVRTGDIIHSDPIVHSLTIGFEDGLTAHIGQGTGASSRLSKTRGQLEVMSDGHQMFLASYQQEGDPYLRKIEQSVTPTQLSGTEAPIALLARALSGETAAQSELHVSMDDFLRAQKICFAALLSDADEGRRTPLDAVPLETVFWGKSGDNYA